MTNRLFKIIGIILIATLVAFLAEVGSEEGPNTWNVVHELYHNDFGNQNLERDRLVVEYEIIVQLFDDLDGIKNELKLFSPNLESETSVLTREYSYANGAYKSVLEAITIFVNNHKGI